MIAQLLDWPPVWLLLHMAAAAGLAALWSPFGLEALLVGGLAMLLGLALAGWAAVTMMRARTTLVPGREADRLVTTGPYAFTRNPIYLADLVIMAGFAFAVGQPFALALTFPLANVLTKRFVEPEEKRLALRFGSQYQDYARKVDRWL